MAGKPRKQELARELPELSATETREGVLVRVRCVEIVGTAGAAGRAGSPRYEIYMDARGFSAIADVRADERARLEARIDEFVGAFVDSVLLRATLIAAM
jgi:hypothetical protein